MITVNYTPYQNLLKIHYILIKKFIILMIIPIFKKFIIVYLFIFIVLVILMKFLRLKIRYRFIKGIHMLLINKIIYFKYNNNDYYYY